MSTNASRTRSIRLRIKALALTTLIAGAVALGAMTSAGGDFMIDLGRGPVTVHVPDSYDPDNPAPLIVLLHGFTGSGIGIENYFQFLPLSEEYGFVYMHPDGTVDEIGRTFWNATDACCDFFDSNVDDAGYLRDLVEAVRKALSIDDRRIYFVGHSNGGFMSYRMACEHSDTVAAIVSLAGATWKDPDDCAPAGPVQTLQIHGTGDVVIRYDGGEIFDIEYPGAVETTEQWAMFNGCSFDVTQGKPLDLDSGINGSETTVMQYITDCLPGGASELWTINGGAHSPNLSDQFGPLVVEWLLAHPKPADQMIATLEDVEIAFGSLLSGGVAELIESDDAYLEVRSARGFTALEPNLVDLIIGFQSPVETASTFNVTVESLINHPAGQGKVRLRDWTTGQFEQVGTFDISQTEITIVLNDIDAADHIRAADNRIEMSLKHIVVATFTALGFDSSFDQVAVGVE